jgi:methylglutaconyl-CoA hydratase
MAICKNGPLAIRAAKKAVDAGLQATSVIEALDAERICYESILETTDRLEGLAAFQEKRTPVYTGK